MATVARAPALGPEGVGRSLAAERAWPRHLHPRLPWSLARSHARSGDRLAIAAYLGKGTRFDRAIAEFSRRYADRNEADHARLREAIAAGELEAREGI